MSNVDKLMELERKNVEIIRQRERGNLGDMDNNGYKMVSATYYPSSVEGKGYLSMKREDGVVGRLMFLAEKGTEDINNVDMYDREYMQVFMSDADEELVSFSQGIGLACCGDEVAPIEMCRGVEMGVSYHPYSDKETLEAEVKDCTREATAPMLAAFLAVPKYQEDLEREDEPFRYADYDIDDLESRLPTEFWEEFSKWLKAEHNDRQPNRVWDQWMDIRGLAYRSEMFTQGFQ